MSRLIRQCKKMLCSVAIAGTALPSFAQVPSTVPPPPPSGPSGVPSLPSTVPAPPKPTGNAQPGTPPATAPSAVPSTVPSAVPSMVPGATPGGPSAVPTLPPTPGTSKPAPGTRNSIKPPAEAPAPAPEAAKPAPPRNPAAKNDLQPQPLSLRTRDGFQLSGTYFPSDKGKKAVPIMLIHEAEGQTGAFRDVALRLQSAGFAVAYVDLRGHGGSTQRLDNTGNLVPWQRKGLTKRDVVAMVQGDLETLKAFLKEENDKEKLNLNSLVLVGIGEGSILALNWAVIDWNFPSIPGKKQGQDVKGLVLISPTRLFEGVSYLPATEHPFVSRLPTMVISGKDADGPEAEKLQKLLGKTRTGANGSAAGALDVQVIPTNLSSSRLLTTPSIAPNVVDLITKFLVPNIVNAQDRNPWVQRSRD
jgi:pimeloyl-ACP methyl ester carboxylesterase